MAKCTICNSRKGKRKCPATETFICSMCCGESRESEKCAGCTFFGAVSTCRNYRGAPYFSTEEMAASPALHAIAEVIESALCLVWESDGRNVNDRTVARLVELMLDEYHFNDGGRTIADPVLAAGHQMLSRTIRDDLSHVDAEKLVKVLGAVYRSIQRRTVGGSSYLEFVSRFTGIW